MTRAEAMLPSDNTESQLIDIPLIDRLAAADISEDFSNNIKKILDSLSNKDYLIRQDSLRNSKRRELCFRVGTGFPGIWVDERSSIIVPDKGRISFDVHLSGSCVLEFSALSLMADGNIDIGILSSDGKTIKKSFETKEYRQRYTEKDATLKWSNIGYEKAKDDTGWSDYQIDLSGFSKQRVSLSFSFNGREGALFIANPRIFKVSDARRYNVIYLIFDGVSTRHFSFYNDRSGLTPFMKEIADKESIVFDNMFTLGNKTRISTAGLFSSVLPYETRHGINRNYIPEEEKENYYRLIRSGRLSALPDIYRNRGYIAEQFGNSGFTIHLNSTGLDYGFDRSYEFSYNPYDSYGISHRFFEFLRKNKSREFFVYLHYNTPHKPFYAPAKYFLKGVLNAPFECLWRPDFMGCINYTDDVFRNIYLALKTNNLLENTILVVATDHGAGYDLKKYDMGFQYNDYTRMTFMIRLPDELKRKYDINKKRVGSYISSINTAPTLVDLCEMDRISAFRGRSYLDVLKDDYSEPFFDREIWCFGRKTASVITDDRFKYILTLSDSERKMEREHYFWGSQMEVPFEEIYDLNSDPEEMKNLVHARKDLLKKFRNIYMKHDFHHPEKSILSFFSDKGRPAVVEVELRSNSKLNGAFLYSGDLLKEEDFSISKKEGQMRIIFKMNNSPLHLVFENENDRSPVTIYIKSDDIPLEKDQIYSTYMNLNIYQNPIVLKDKKDFILLNETRLPSEDDVMYRKQGLTVKISRIDLHRWIDMGNIEAMGISAGMKETLKSWGYIQ